MTVQTLNIGRLSKISYLSNFFLGALISTLGLVIIPVSQAFAQAPETMGQVFTLMNIGIFLTTVSSGVLIIVIHLFAVWPTLGP